jgi:hypothetical protein
MATSQDGYRFQQSSLCGHDAGIMAS